MPRTEPAEPGGELSSTKTPSSWIASLTIDETMTALQISQPKFVEEHVVFTVGGR